MRVEIFCSEKKFEKEKKTIKETLSRLDKPLNLAGGYLEVHLIDGDFTVRSFEPPENFPRPDIGMNYKNLGEIYVCPEHIYRTNKSYRTNRTYLTFLLIHGLLHLLGYDHKKDNDRIRMEERERQLLKFLQKNNGK